MVLILGVESTAHTFGIGIVKNGKVLANVTDTYTTEKGGIIPMESAKHHVQVCDKVLEDAIKEASIRLNDVDAIAFSNAPGLAPCLLEGLRFTTELASKLKLPVVPVNHCVAHLEIGKITGAKDSVLLYCSGANTQIIAYSSGKYRIFGETLDIGVGNFIDNFARFAGIGFPGGPKIQKLAEQGKKENFIELPYSIKGMDVAFSGILTNLKQKVESKKYKIEDLAFSMQETVFAMLVEAAERALAHTGKKELLLGGGVACNTRLQEMCKIMCKERGAKLFVPENSLLADNGAMIAYLGEIMFRKGLAEKNLNNTKNSKNFGATKSKAVPTHRTDEDFVGIDIAPRERTDDVIVRWK